MYPLAFSLTSPLVYPYLFQKISTQDLECVDKVWRTAICVKGSFLSTRSKALSIQAGGIVHLKESVVSEKIICGGSITGWYSQTRDIESRSGVSIIGCKVADVVAEGTISCKKSIAGSLRARSLWMEESQISGNVSLDGSVTILKSDICGCIYYTGESLYLSDSLVGSILFQKRSFPAVSSKQIVYLNNCRVSGSILFKSGQGEVISQGSTPKFSSLNGKTWVQKI